MNQTLRHSDITSEEYGIHLHVSTYYELAGEVMKNILSASGPAIESWTLASALSYADELEVEKKKKCSK